MMANKIVLRSIWRVIGLAVCVLPPVIATLMYFPLWRCVGGDKILSGGAVLLIAIAHAPIIRWLRERLATAANYSMWLVLFIVFWLLSSIAAEMKVISMTGFLSNLLGAFILKVADRIGEEKIERQKQN